MRRPTVRRQQPGVALFPFLAVLICTMGALIVLLVLVVQGAQASARNEALAKAKTKNNSAEQAHLQEAVEELEWRTEIMQVQQNEFADKLKNKRLELSHLEDHIRRLREQAEQLKAQAIAFSKVGKEENMLDADFGRLQIEELQKQIAAKKKELDEAKRKVASAKPAYAIIPYEGPHGTSRRPIYIECREDGILLQPEGILLTVADFQGPLGPGNPLDAALRAVREHQAALGLPGEPYPLVIVRPNGALAFGACRTAMKHWENEFGYELVQEDTELKFPAPDPTLAATLQRTLRDARTRQTALAAAMPNRFAGETQLVSFRASEQPPSEMLGGSGTGNTTGGSGGVGTRGTPGSGVGGNGSLGENYGLAGESGMTSGANAPRGLSGTGNYNAQQGLSAGMQSGLPGMAPWSGNPAGSGSTNAAGGGNATIASTGTNQLRNGASGTSSQGSTTGTNSVAGATGQNGTAGRTSGGSANASSLSQAGGSGSAGSASGSGSAGGSSSSGSASSGQEQGGVPSLNITAGQTSALAKASKARQNRANNWALPESQQKATPITRPIYVDCLPDKFILLADKNEGRAPLVVPLEESLQTQVDSLLGAVWQHMDRWGLAILNGYWKPVLVVNVQPGADARFAELQQALQGSGIDVERKR
jgi:archaellum component FlaC